MCGPCSKALSCLRCVCEIRSPCQQDAVCSTGSQSVHALYGEPVQAFQLPAKHNKVQRCLRWLG